MSAKVATILQSLIDSGAVYELSKQHEQDIRCAYPELTYEEQGMLFYNIQACGGADDTYNHLTKDPVDLRNTLLEAAHQNYEGWTEEQKVVIRAFLADIAQAAHYM